MLWRMGEKRISAFKICITLLSWHKKLKTSAILTGTFGVLECAHLLRRLKGLKNQSQGSRWNGLQNTRMAAPLPRALGAEVPFLEPGLSWSSISCANNQAFCNSTSAGRALLVKYHIIPEHGKCQPPLRLPDQGKEVSETAQVMCLGITKHVCAFLLLRKYGEFIKSGWSDFLWPTKSEKWKHSEGSLTMGSMMNSNSTAPAS